jgi:hypothetical protein
VRINTGAEDECVVWRRELYSCAICCRGRYIVSAMCAQGMYRPIGDTHSKASLIGMPTAVGNNDFKQCTRLRISR